MCMRIVSSSQQAIRWEPRINTLTLPPCDDPAIRDQLIRAALVKLAIPQPPRGAVCWCGQPLGGPAGFPHQRQSTEVMARGA